jgi:hypothetical protein
MARSRHLFIYLPFMLVLLGVGVRLMYYGIETIVGSSPRYGWTDIVVMLAGVALFIGGIALGVFILPSSAVRHQ